MLGLKSDYVWDIAGSRNPILQNMFEGNSHFSMSFQIVLRHVLNPSDDLYLGESEFALEKGEGATTWEIRVKNLSSNSIPCAI